jgi:ribose 5-phosphate isomerase
MDKLIQCLTDVAASRSPPMLIVGIGSGRTIEHFIDRHLLGVFKEAQVHLEQVLFIPTSYRTKLKLIGVGFAWQLGDLQCHPHVDVLIDGFDCLVADDRIALKGGGGCLLWEKLVYAQSSNRFLIGFSDKFLPLQGSHYTIPLEVVPEAATQVCRQVESLGRSSIRQSQDRGKLGPVVTDLGHWVVDISIDAHGAPINWHDVHNDLKLRTGVVDTGIFIGPFTPIQLID